MIYFAHDEAAGAVKIGFATDVAKRLRQLQTAHSQELILLGTLEGNTDDERTLHRQLADDRLKGEWFGASPAVMEFIRGVLAARGRPRTVAEELLRRNYNRFGLRGVRVAVKGLGAEPWEVGRTRWDFGRRGMLVLSVWSPGARSDPIDVLPGGRRVSEGGLVTTTLSYVRLKPDPDPPSTMRNVPAENCYLLSDWPKVFGGREV